MSNFTPPPISVPVLHKNIRTNADEIHPIWKKWFIDLAKFVTLSGGGGPIDISTTNGMIARIATAAYVGRTITGTAVQVGVTNGDGVAGDPTIDIAPHLAAADPHPQYETNMVTGTWTPVLTFATPGDLAVAYTTQNGFLMSIGKMIVATFNLLTSSFTHTTAAGNLLLTGLTTAAITTANYVASGSGSWGGITKAGYTDMAYEVVATSPSQIQMRASGSGVASALVAAADTPTGGTMQLAGTVVYQVP
jgi:hypothetical protein